VILALPYVLLQIWMFIAPGLHKGNARRDGIYSSGVRAVFGGLVFAYYVICRT